MIYCNKLIEMRFVMYKWLCKVIVLWYKFEQRYEQCGNVRIWDNPVEYKPQVWIHDMHEYTDVVINGGPGQLRYFDTLNR